MKTIFSSITMEFYLSILNSLIKKHFRKGNDKDIHKLGNYKSELNPGVALP